MKKTLVFTVIVLSLAAAGATPALAQNQLTLADGGVNSFFFGGGSNHIAMTMPNFNCSGTPVTCVLAAATATGTGTLSSSGTYSITAPGTTPVPGGYAGPFTLTVLADGSSVVSQSAPITFTYTSPQGTLTGLLNFTTVSKTIGINSTMLGTFQATGGTFAPLFPGGGNVSITLGVLFPLQLFPTTMHAFAAVEFQNGTIVPAAVCQTLSLNQRQWQLPHHPYDLNASFTQTNNPSQIPCSSGSPCGTMDVAQGTGPYSNDLVVTIQLTGVGGAFQFDRLGFNSDLNSGFTLDCFNFGASCSSGTGGASLGGAMNEDGFGSFANTLFTGLSGGSGCAPDGTGCQTLFTFAVGNTNGPLQLSDFNEFVAGHIANGACSGFIATPSN